MEMLWGKRMIQVHKVHIQGVSNRCTQLQTEITLKLGPSFKSPCSLKKAIGPVFDVR